jgi:chemotaxis response regulator CheB
MVQHVDTQFVASMAAWLGERSRVPVRVARKGDKAEVGVALLAGSDDHLVFTNSGLLSYDPEPRDSFYRPSIDVFFHSVARNWKGNAAGVLLTGMGRDGAEGLKAIRAAGLMTVAQDAGTSVVYGMPKAAVQLEAAIQILPLGRIADALVDFVSNSLPRVRS